MIEKIKDFGEMLKVYVIILSIFVAGWWTYSTFIIVHRNEVNRMPNLTAHIDATPIIHGDDKYIKAIVTVENKGNDPIWLDLGVNSLTVNKVNFDEKPSNQYVSLTRKAYKGYLDNEMMVLGDIKEMELSPNSEFEFAYAAKLKPDDKGLFYVNFLGSQRHEAMRSSLQKKGYNDIIVMSIQTSDYIYIK